MFIEDPAYLCEVAIALVEQQEQSEQRKTKRERQAMSVSTIGRVMEMITLRHRLLEAAWETEVLSEVSRQLKPLHAYNAYNAYNALIC